MSDRRKVLDLFEEQNDTWRKRAAEGIERYRKGDGVVTVVDEAGNPVSNAKIKLIQKTHEFRFGANLFMLDELETDEKNEKYKKYFSVSLKIKGAWCFKIGKFIEIRFF